VDAFISYSHADRPFVQRLRDALIERSKTVWVDEQDIPAASRWADDLKGAIEQADSFVFVISPDAVASVECRKELDHAASLNKRIIPVKTRETPVAALPEELRRRQFVPGRGTFDDDFDSSLAQLVSAIDTDLDWVHAHTAWGTKAVEWDEHRRDHSFLLSGSELNAAETWIASSTGKEPAPTALQQTYVLTSRQAATRRQRILFSGVTVALVVAVVLSIVALVQRSTAVSNEHVAQSRQYAASSTADLGSDPQTATLLALKALGYDDSSQAESALRAALPDVQVLGRWRGPQGEDVTSAAFAPGDREFVATSRNGTASVVDAATMRTGRVLREPHGAAITEASFSPDGAEVVTASTDGYVRVFSVASGRVVMSEHVARPGEVTTAEFSPVGSEIVATGNGAATIYEVPSGTAVATLPPAFEGSGFTAAAFNAKGTEVAVASTYGYVEVFPLDGNAPTLLPSRSVLEHGGAFGLITSVTFSPDSSEVAFSAGDGTARVFDVASQRQVTTISSLGAPVISSVAFSPRGEELVTSGHDGAIEIWQAATGRPLLALNGDTGVVNSAEFSSDGKEVLSASTDGTARVWDAIPRQATTELFEPGDGAVLNGSFSPDGDELVTASSDGTTRVWEGPSGRLLTTIPSPPGQSAATAAWDPAGSPQVLTAAAQAPNEATIWDAESGGIIRTMTAPGGSGIDNLLLDAQFSPNGKDVVAAGQGGTGWIWNDVTGRLLRQLRLPTRTVINTAVFNSRGTEVLTGDGDGTARVFSVKTGRQLDVVHIPGRPDVLSAVFNQQATEVLTATADGRASVWELDTGKRVFSVTLPGGAIVNAATFNPQGTEVLTASDDGTARLWSVSSGTLLTTFGSVGDGSIVYATFDRAGNQVLTCDEDGVTTIWSPELAAPVASLESIGRQWAATGLTSSQLSAYIPGN
jgi:WD40 repeat protein